MKKKEPMGPMGNWRDTWGQRFRSPVGEYKVGQFSPTGAQLVSVAKKREVKP